MCACGQLLLQLRGNLPLETEQGRGLCVHRQHVLTMGALARLTQVGKFLLMYSICLFFFFFKLVKHNIGNFTFDECEGRCTTFVVCSLCDTRSQPGTVLGSEDIVVSIKGWFSPF